MRHYAIRALAPFALIAVPSLGAAQQFEDFCPGADAETQAAVVGYVTDPEADTVVPGAVVAASWVQDGTRQRVEATAGLDGLYALCGLPQEAEVQLRAVFGDRRGEAVPYTTAVLLAQQDLEVSLTAEPDEEEIEVSQHARTGRAYSSDLINAEDLLALPEMSVYQLLRQHQRLRFDRWTEGEVILFDHVVSNSLNQGRFRGIQVYINERREADPVSAIREMSIDEVRQIQILTATEASARYGGDGYLGVIAIRTRDR